MKAFQLKSLIAAAIAVTLSACEKKSEDISSLSEKTVNATSEVVYPLIGTEIPNNILPQKKLPRAVLTKGYYYPNVKVKLIDTVCLEYIRATTKLNFSNLREGAFVNKFGNSEFKITADHEFNSSGFARLSNGPKGWWTHWNYSPYTESEYPEVLFARNRYGGEVRGVNSMTLVFDKPVTMFGFEIAPNLTGKDYIVNVEYLESSTYRAQTLFNVEQTISSPSGARLIAVKSETPLTFLMINIQGMTFQEAGFAIANIRYAIAK